MKMHKRSLGIFILIILVTVLQSCKSTDDTGGFMAVNDALAKLEGSWDISQGGSVVVDGRNLNRNYIGFAISFTDGGYVTTNAGDLFKASGLWEWRDLQATQINLDDGKQMVIENLTDEIFVFSFNFAGTGGNANGINGSSGNYTITLNR